MYELTPSITDKTNTPPVEIANLIKSAISELNKLIDIGVASGLIVTLTGNGSVPGEIKSHKHVPVKVKIQKIIEY